MSRLSLRVLIFSGGKGIIGNILALGGIAQATALQPHNVAGPGPVDYINYYFTLKTTIEDFLGFIELFDCTTCHKKRAALYTSAENNLIELQIMEALYGISKNSTKQI
jgi:hypothetical protein